MEAILQWFQSNDTLLWVMFIVSVVTFVATLIVVPILVVRLPSNHFAPTIQQRRKERRAWTPRRIAVHVVKNGFGFILVVAGIGMLVLPGQGILTLLIGIMLLDFPGKYALERRLISMPRVLRGVNWMRRRAGRAPMQLEDRKVDEMDDNARR